MTILQRLEEASGADRSLIDRAMAEGRKLYKHDVVCRACGTGHLATPGVGICRACNRSLADRIDLSLLRALETEQ